MEYHTYSNHLGSINYVADAIGGIIAEQSFDAWGRCRNPQDWTYTNIPTNNPDWLYRGFIGHEHILGPLEL